MTIPYLNRAAGLLALISLLSATSALKANTYSFDASLRERVNYLSSSFYAPLDRDDRWFWTQRLNLVGSYESESGWGGRVNILSALLEGVDENTVNRNNLDIHELFIDAPLADGRLRFGRQELLLGSQRFVGTREGTNVRRNWDGVRWTRQWGETSIDAFYMELVDVTPNGAFNDSSESNRSLSGIYLTRQFDQRGLDFYYLHSRKDQQLTIEGVADQRRETVGVRHFGERGPWSWNHEVAYQFGRHGDLDIETWTVASITGRQFEGAWQPELRLSMNVASGDDDPGDGELGTFEALYPRGNYFSEAAVLGPSNFYNIHPQVSIRPIETLTVNAGINWFWRLEKEDGVYGPSGLPFALPGASGARAVSRSISASVSWAFRPGQSLALDLTHSTPRAFLKESGRGETLRFVQVTYGTNF
ncbi:MAG: alginate export family protein [Pseudomonadota bacterium]